MPVRLHCFCCGSLDSCSGGTFFDNVLGREEEDSLWEEEQEEEEVVLEEYEESVIEPIFQGECWVPP